MGEDNQNERAAVIRITKMLMKKGPVLMHNIVVGLPQSIGEVC